jgi:transcriptional regulator with XRE-family HTH domain
MVIERDLFLSVVGQTFRRARMAKGLSQGDLSVLVGVRPATISNFEREESLPDLSTVWRVADRLDLPLDVLVGRTAPQTTGGEGAFEREGDRLGQLETEIRETRRIVDNLVRSARSVEHVPVLLQGARSPGATSARP